MQYEVNGFFISKKIDFISKNNQIIQLTQQETFILELFFSSGSGFVSTKEIESIVSLRDCIEIGLEIDHLSIMTGTVAKKLKNHLLVN